jgi:hypothetical protein
MTVTRPGRRRILLAVGAVIVAAQIVPLGIPTTVVPPRPADPATVYLVDYGKTSILVVTVAEDIMIAYAYGDWTYYALRKQGPFESIAALLWPTQGTLGRKEINGPSNVATVRRELGLELEEIHQFEVERSALARLHAKLDGIYNDQLGTAVESYGMTFVHHPKPYTYWSNSNHVTAEWLRELGCETRGPAYSAWWRIRAAS